MLIVIRLIGIRLSVIMKIVAIYLLLCWMSLCWMSWCQSWTCTWNCCRFLPLLVTSIPVLHLRVRLKPTRVCRSLQAENHFSPGRWHSNPRPRDEEEGVLPLWPYRCAPTAVPLPLANPVNQSFINESHFHSQVFSKLHFVQCDQIGQNFAS